MSESSASKSKKLWKIGTLTYTTGGLIVLFCWLLFGDFSWSMRERSVSPMSQWYLSSLNVPNMVFGLILTSFPAAIGLVLTPIISVKSDRYRSRWGRRIPFLLVTTPIAALGMIGIAVTPIVASWMHELFPAQEEWVVAVVCFSVFWTAFEFATIAGQAVFGGLINDVVPKEMLGRFFGLFRAVSLIDGMIFNYWIMGRVPDFFTLILLVIGVFYGTAFMLVCFKVKEGEYPPPPPKDSSSAGILARSWKEIRAYGRECFTNSYYLAVFIMVTLAYLSFGPVNIFALLYAKSLGIDMDAYGKYLALTYLISLSLSFFLGWLVDLFHPLRMAMISLFGYSIVTALAGIFATTQTTFLIAWVAHGVLAGSFMTTAASLGQRLFPHEKFAQYASAAGILVSLAFIAIGPVVGMIIDISGTVYRYTFISGFVLSLLGLLVGVHVHRRFMKYGGPNGYIAPE